ncbi:MAG: hypothetical protein ABI164_11645, partial [Acidobacteriaceae bacterium]
MSPLLLAQQGPPPDAPSTVMARQRSLDARTNNSETLAFEQRQSAFNRTPALPEQQSLYHPGPQSAPPGYSSSLAENQPIPGASPILHNPCPSYSCSMAQNFMCCGMAPSPFLRYLHRPYTVQITASDNLNSAVRNIINPFNLLTIAGDSAISVASNPHSAYGPGLFGFSKAAGVSLTEDMTGEFFGTFLIPSILHQDPHYHRRPFVSVPRRLLHALTQVVWSQSYSGKPMFNYSNVVGGI